jgi:hypothetical protein
MMEDGSSFINGVLLFNFLMPIVIPVIFVVRLRHAITRKIMYLLTTIPACYFGGVVVISIIYNLEKRSGVYDGAADPSLIGFVSQNLSSLFLYALTAWIISRFFRGIQKQKPLR